MIQPVYVFYFTLVLFSISWLRTFGQKGHYARVHYGLCLLVTVLVWYFLPKPFAVPIFIFLLGVFHFLPGALILWCNQCVYQGQFKTPMILANVLRFLMPVGPYGHMARYYQGFHLMEGGQMEEGLALVQGVIDAQIPKGSRLIYFSLQNALTRYDQVCQEMTPEDIQAMPQILTYKLRALGETGRMNELVALCQAHHREILGFGNELALANLLILAAYSGNTTLMDIVDQRKIHWFCSPWMVDFSKVTFEYVRTGDEAAYQEALKRLAITASPIQQKMLAHRQQNARIGILAEPLSEESQRLLAEMPPRLMRLKSRKFAALLNKWRIGTCILLLLNGSLFYLMPMTYPFHLASAAQLGALVYPYSLHTTLSLHTWLSSMLIHRDVWHFAATLLAFGLFPLAEKRLGTPRFYLLYLLIGISALFLALQILQIVQPAHTPVVLIGGSGGVMGILGALLGVTLKDWHTDGLEPVKKRLMVLSGMIGLQIAVALIIPGLSLWIPLLGFLLGFTLIFPLDMLSRKARMPGREQLRALIIAWGVFLVLALGQIGVARFYQPSLTADDALENAYLYEYLKQSADAAKWYLQAARQGNLFAQQWLAYNYLTGEKLKLDKEQGFFWVEKAAQQKDPWAEFTLGQSYDHGTGVKRNSTLALAWYRRSADHNYLDAQLLLGKAYEKGTSLKQDLPEAYYWYSRAARHPQEELSEAQASPSKALKRLESVLSSQEIADTQQRLSQTRKP